MSDVFRSADGDLGVFVVNAGTKDLEFPTNLDPTRYGMAADSVVDVDRILPTTETAKIHRNMKDLVTLTGTISDRTIIMYHIKITEDQ